MKPALSREEHDKLTKAILAAAKEIGFEEYDYALIFRDNANPDPETEDIQVYGSGGAEVMMDLGISLAQAADEIKRRQRAARN